MTKHEWISAGAGVVAAVATVGILAASMMTVAANFAARMEASLNAIRTEMQSVRTDMQSVRTDMQSVRTEMQSVRTDMQSVRTEMQSVRAESQESTESLRTEMQKTIRESIEAAQEENRGAHEELERKFEILGGRIDRLYELLLDQANP